MVSKRIANFIAGLWMLALAACATTPPAPTATFTPAPTETATPVPTATATLEPTDTPTATVVPTRTPAPTFTATPVPQPGDELFSDTFENNAHNWEAIYANQATFKVEDEGLTGEIKQKNVLYWTLQRGQYKDVDMTFEATRLSSLGGEMMYGGICRYTDSNNFYLFEINSGNYSIQHLDEGKWKAIVDWKASGAIHTGKVVNTLRIICVGEMLQFWVNGTKLVTVHYPGLKDGFVALTAGTFNTNDAKVKFDNLSIKVPEPSTLASGGGSQANGTPKPTSPGGSEATQAATQPAVSNGQGSIQIENTIDFGVHFVLWGPSDQVFDAPPHQTITLTLPSGEYGWQVFANNCELYPTDNLVVKPSAHIRVETYTENNCGYAVRWAYP